VILFLKLLMPLRVKQEDVLIRRRSVFAELWRTQPGYTTDPCCLTAIILTKHQIKGKSQYPH